MTTPEQLLERLEAVERTATGPPAQTGDRVWSAIEARLANGPAPPELDEGPLLDHATASVGGSSSVVLKVVGALVIAGVVGGGLALLVGDRDRRPDNVANVATVEPEPDAPEPVASEPEPVEPEPEPVEPEPVEPEPESEPEPPPPEPPKPASTTSKTGAQQKPAAPKSLADEVALMQALSTALKQGDSRKVLTLVAEHERDFGKGQFIEERRAAKARALCQSGKLAAGNKEAASFASRWPNSIHLASVKQDCGLD